MNEREKPGGLPGSLGAFPADAGAPGHDNLYDEDVLSEAAMEIGDLIFSNPAPRRVVRMRERNQGE